MLLNILWELRVTAHAVVQALLLIFAYRMNRTPENTQELVHKIWWCRLKSSSSFHCTVSLSKTRNLWDILQRRAWKWIFTTLVAVKRVFNGKKVVLWHVSLRLMWGTWTLSSPPLLVFTFIIGCFCWRPEAGHVYLKVCVIFFRLFQLVCRRWYLYLQTFSCLNLNEYSGEFPKSSFYLLSK